LNLLWLLRLKALLRFLILPPSGPLLLALFGLYLQRRRVRYARWCLVGAIGSLWLLSTPLIADALTRLAERSTPLDLSAPIDAQAIVILGGGGQRALAPEYGGPAANPVLLERLSYGAYIAGKTGLPLLVTGYRIEAAAMRASLERNFALEPRWIDDQAYDTFQNAANAKALLARDGVRRIILVTSATHMWRAVQEFVATGLSVVPAPVGGVSAQNLDLFSFIPSAEALLGSSLATYELLGESVRSVLAATHLRRQARD
jgi:uncharacterized SAM-binding protein YcdF (DUF218 family)